MMLPCTVVFHRGSMIMHAMSNSNETDRPSSYSLRRRRFRLQPGPINMFGPGQDNNSASDTTEPSINLRIPRQ